MSMILSKTVTGWVVAWEIDGMVQMVAFPSYTFALATFPSAKFEDWLCGGCEEYKTSMHGNPDSGCCSDCYDEAQRDARDCDDFFSENGPQEADFSDEDYNDQFPANLI